MGKHDVVTYDKYYNPIYENDWVITKHGRVCKVVWRRTISIIGYDLEPVAFLKYPPPDPYDMWNPLNLILIDSMNIMSDENKLEKIIKEHIGVKD